MWCQEACLIKKNCAHFVLEVPAQQKVTAGRKSDIWKPALPSLYHHRNTHTNRPLKEHFTQRNAINHSVMPCYFKFVRRTVFLAYLHRKWQTYWFIGDHVQQHNKNIHLQTPTQLPQYHQSLTHPVICSVALKRAQRSVSSVFNSEDLVKMHVIGKHWA